MPLGNHFINLSKSVPNKLYTDTSCKKAVA
jgi:hypothetical protein